MVYALVYYPKIDVRCINQFRRKYDPQVDLIAPHITLMFPVPQLIARGNLVHHIDSVLRNWRSFPIHLQGLYKSRDSYLFLTVQEGSADIVSLHDEIYRGMLADYQREDIPFIPHITLGEFSKDENQYLRALEEARELNLDYHCVIDKLHLVEINDDRSQIVGSKEF